MTKLMPGLLLASFSAFGQEAERSNTTSTTWEIYGLVALVFVVGFVVVYFKQKK